MIQFRLRTLFILTAASAVLFGALYAPPQWLGLVVLYVLYFLFPAAALAGIVYHRGYWRAFFIGMAPSLAIMFLTRLDYLRNPFLSPSFVGVDFPLPEELIPADESEIVMRKIAVACWLGMAVSSGVIAVAVRWWAISLQRRGEDVEMGSPSNS